MSAPTSPAFRAPRQLRLPRRSTCLPPRRSSRRDRGTQRRPDPVRWSARRATPADKAGVGPQAASLPNRPARSPGRCGFLAAGRPAPAGGPRRPPPATTETTRVPASVPASLSPCPCWSPRPSTASPRPPASPPFAAPRASSARLQASTAELAVFAFGAPEVAKAMLPHTAFMASLRFEEAVVPPFSFLASVTRAQPSLATCIFAATRCGGENLDERRKISSARDSCSAAVGASSDSSASASAAISARVCARAQQLQICLY